MNSMKNIVQHHHYRLTMIWLNDFRLFRRRFVLKRRKNKSFLFDEIFVENVSLPFTSLLFSSLLSLSVDFEFEDEEKEKFFSIRLSIELSSDDLIDFKWISFVWPLREENEAIRCRRRRFSRSSFRIASMNIKIRLCRRDFLRHWIWSLISVGFGCRVDVWSYLKAKIFPVSTSQKKTKTKTKDQREYLFKGKSLLKWKYVEKDDDFGDQWFSSAGFSMKKILSFFVQKKNRIDILFFLLIELILLTNVR